MRLISSHKSQPTSPTQTSFVPGRSVKRNGLRRPYATSNWLMSALALSGLVPGSRVASAGAVPLLAASAVAPAWTGRLGLRPAKPGVGGFDAGDQGPPPDDIPPPTDEDDEQPIKTQIGSPLLQPGRERQLEGAEHGGGHHRGSTVCAGRDSTTASTSGVTWSRS